MSLFERGSFGEYYDRCRSDEAKVLRNRSEDKVTLLNRNGREDAGLVAGKTAGCDRVLGLDEVILGLRV